MPLLREVEAAYPATRFPDRAWDPDVDKAAFLARSLGVFELYCRGLPAAMIPARRSMVRFFLDEDKPAGFHVRLPPKPLEAFESANIAVPDRFATWAEEDQLRACLEVIHQGLLGLGRARGWPLAPLEALEALRDQVAEQGLRLWWASAWKLSPNRRHKARGVYRISPDGYGRVQLEVRAATGRDEILARTEVDALCELALADVQQALVNVAAKRRLPPPPRLPDNVYRSRRRTNGS